MNDTLAKILSAKAREVEAARARRPEDELRRAAGRAPAPRNFYGAVTVPRRRPNLIAECKQRSPSAGVIVRGYDPAAVARRYEAAGAAALSVLTDDAFFGGALEHLEAVRAAVALPLLRKDFLIAPYQIWESRAAGADAVLLIAEALEIATLAELYALACGAGFSAVLVEVHAAEQLSAVLQAIPPARRDRMLLGINNRDLRAQRTDLGTTERLSRMAPPGLPLVAESGIRTRADVDRMHAVGARALLIGESLLRADSIAAAVAELGLP